MTCIAQWFQTYGAMIQTIALVITLGVIIAYTIFTYGLKRATVKQTELSLRPCLTFYYENYFMFTNIGHSPAINITIDNFEDKKFRHIFEKIDLRMADEAKRIGFIKVGKDDPPGTTYRREYHLNKIGTEFALTIRYENIESKRCYSKVKIFATKEKVEFLETGKC